MQTFFDGIFYQQQTQAVHSNNKIQKINVRIKQSQYDLSLDYLKVLFSINQTFEQFIYIVSNIKEKELKTFDDIQKETSQFLTHSYLQKGGKYQNQLNAQMQMEQEIKKIKEQQIKLIEEKEQIQLDVSNPVQANDFNYLMYGNRNSDITDKLGTNHIQSKRIHKSSIISHRQSKEQDTLTNMQFGDTSMKLQQALDLEFEKKKVQTEVYVADSDNQIETYASLDNNNLLEKSKPINGGWSVQTAYFNKKNSMSFNNTSGFYSNRNEQQQQQQNQISRFCIAQQFNNLQQSSELDRQQEDYETDFQERGEETIEKFRITRYQFEPLQAHLTMKSEQIFSKKNSNNVSFQDNSNNSNRIISQEQLTSESKKIETFSQTNQQNFLNIDQSKESANDQTSIQIKVNTQQQFQQSSRFSFMQSHQFQDQNHNSTADFLSQQNQLSQYNSNKIGQTQYNPFQSFHNMTFKQESIANSLQSPKFKEYKDLEYVIQQENSNTQRRLQSEEFLILSYKKFTQYIDQFLVFANEQFQFSTIEKSDSILKLQKIDKLWKLSFIKKDSSKDKILQQSLISSIEGDQINTYSNFINSSKAKNNTNSNQSSYTNCYMVDETIDGIASFETYGVSNFNHPHLFVQVKRDKVTKGQEFQIENYCIKIINICSKPGNKTLNYQNQEQNIINQQHNINQQSNSSKQININQQNRVSQQQSQSPQLQQNKQNYHRSQSVSIQSKSNGNSNGFDLQSLYVDLIVTDLDAAQNTPKSREVKFCISKNNTYILGRNNNCDLCLGNSTTISNKHCFFNLGDDNQIYINDNQSSNGTWKKMNYLEITKESVGYHFKLDISGQEIKIIAANSKSKSNEMKKGICYKCLKPQQDIIIFQEEEMNSLCIKCFQVLQIHDNFSIKLVS